jgi:hypothetical protein
MTSIEEDSPLPYKLTDTVSQQSKCFLMSTSIPPHIAGLYHLHQTLLLSRNEVCRREFARLFRAMKTFDVLKKPWKALALQRWLSEYFLLLIAQFERQKRVFLYERFNSLGYDIPFEISLDDAFLHRFIVSIAQISSEVCNLSLMAASRFSPHKLLDKTTHLKEKLDLFQTVMESHFDQEEKFWPEKLLLEGKDESFQILSKMAIDLRDTADSSLGELCMASVLYTAGHMQRQATTNTDSYDLPWCDARSCSELMKTLPYVIKVVPFMHQVSRLLTYRAMLSSLEKSEDDLDLLTHYRQEQFEQHIGCGGFISSFMWHKSLDENSVKKTFDKKYVSMRRLSADSRAAEHADKLVQSNSSSHKWSFRKSKPSQQLQHGLRSVSLDSLSGKEASWKSPPSPGSPTLHKVVPSGQNGFGQKSFLSPRFQAMVSHSGSTDTTDSLISRSSNPNHHPQAVGMIRLGSDSLSP